MKKTKNCTSSTVSDVSNGSDPWAGKAALQPHSSIYEKISVAAGSGVVCVKTNLPFKISVAKMSRKVQTLVKNKKVAAMISHRSLAIPTEICAVELLDFQGEP